MAAFSDLGVQQSLTGGDKSCVQLIFGLGAAAVAAMPQSGGEIFFGIWSIFLLATWFDMDLKIPNPKSLILGLSAAAAAGGVAQSGECTQINRVPQAASFSDLGRPSSSFDNSRPPHCIFIADFHWKVFSYLLLKWTLEIFGQVVTQIFSVSYGSHHL